MAKRKSTKGQATIYKKKSNRTKHRVTRTPQNTGGELRCSGMVSSSCSSSDTRRVNLFKKTVISHETSYFYCTYTIFSERLFSPTTSIIRGLDIFAPLCIDVIPLCYRNIQQLGFIGVVLSV